MRLHFFNSAVIANSKMDYFTGYRLIRRTLKPLFPTLERREGSWGRNMCPAIASGIVTKATQAAIGQFFSLTLKKVPDVLARINRVQSPSEVVNEPPCLLSSYRDERFH